MKNKALGRRILVSLTLMATTILANPLVVQAQDAAEANAERLGMATLLPPILAIILAFTTKDVILSLFIGVFSGAYIIQLASGVNVLMALVTSFTAVVQEMLDALADPWNAGIVLQVMAIGGLIALISKTGGAQAVAESLAQYAKGPVSTQLITWLLGLLVFFDDYANALIVGPIMRPVSDNIGNSRERLAFVIDATAAPVTGMALISTWIGYELSLISEAFNMIGQEVNTYGFFLETLPYRFYNIFMLAFVVITSITLREFGPMKDAQLRARDQGQLVEEDSHVETNDQVVEEGQKGSIWNAVLPIVMLIIFSFVGFYFDGRQALLAEGGSEIVSILENNPLSFVAIRETFGASDASLVLFQSALAASIIALIMGVWQKYFSLSDGIESWFDGMKSLMSTAGVLILAWSLSSVMGSLGTAEFLVSQLGTVISPILLPSIIFALGSIITFATGTSFGTMGILMPLAIPLAYNLDPGNSQLLLTTSAAVLAGAILGDHSSPISDTTIMSSMGAGSNLIHHVRTQLPYVLTVGLISIVFGYIPSAMGVPVWLLIPVAIVVLVVLVYFIGEPINVKDSNNIYQD